MWCGRLLAVGGAAGPSLLGHFVELAGRSIVVIATAATDPSAAEAEHVAAFTRLGAGSVRALRLTTRAEASDPAVEPVLTGATGVFFTGGDQLRITSTLGGTRTDSMLQELVAAGRVVLGGTSAGAAMMSGTMIVGGDGHAVSTGPGLEFLPGVVIDMHFAERGRLNRLLAAVARYPHELGLGIDEDTAILTSGDAFEVLGSGSVTVVDAGAATDIRVSDQGPPAIAEVRVHVLPAGCTFDLSGRRPSIFPAGTLRGRAA